MQWLAGDTALRAQIAEVVERLERDDGVEWLRKRDQRRRLARVPLGDGRSLFAKHYLATVATPCAMPGRSGSGSPPRGASGARSCGCAPRDCRCPPRSPTCGSRRASTSW